MIATKRHLCDLLSALTGCLVIGCSPSPSPVESKMDSSLGDVPHEDVSESAGDNLCAAADCPAAGDIQDDATADQAAAMDGAPVGELDCPSPTLDLTTSHKTLVPPPIGVTVDALSSGKSVAKSCKWQAGPASVCALVDFGLLKKVGDGTCTVSCHLPDGSCGRKELMAKMQTVVYVVGGITPQGGVHSARISRLRVTDQEWDLQVGVAPEKRRYPSLGQHQGKIFLVGGAVDGSDFEYEFDPEFFPKCPEAIVSQGGTELGCRVIRAFDLDTGAWTTPAELPRARWWMGTAQIGQALYLAGGQQGDKPPFDPTHMYRFDMAKGTLHASPNPPEGAPNLLSRLVLFGSDLLQFQGPASWKYIWDSESWQPIDLGFPCKTKYPLSAVFSLPLAEPNLFVLAYDSFESGPGGACPAPKLGDPATPAIFKRYYKGKWSDMEPVDNYGSFFVTARGPDAVYLLQEAYFQAPNPPPPPPVYRIASIDGTWEKLPPMPYWRSDFAAVAVEQ